MLAGTRAPGCIQYAREFYNSGKGAPCLNALGSAQEGERGHAADPLGGDPGGELGGGDGALVLTALMHRDMLVYRLVAALAQTGSVLLRVQDMLGSLSISSWLGGGSGDDRAAEPAATVLDPGALRPGFKQVHGAILGQIYATVADPDGRLALDPYSRLAQRHPDLAGAAGPTVVGSHVARHPGIAGQFELPLGTPGARKRIRQLTQARIPPVGEGGGGGVWSYGAAAGKQIHSATRVVLTDVALAGNSLVDRGGEGIVSRQAPPDVQRPDAARPRASSPAHPSAPHPAPRAARLPMPPAG